MDPSLIQSINQEVYRRFPELNGCAPRIQAFRQKSGRTKQPGLTERLGLRLGIRFGSRPPAYLLVYQSRKQTATGKTLPYIVRVVVEENGKILKTTLSH
jgi:hypothetical protein